MFRRLGTSVAAAFALAGAASGAGFSIYEHGAAATASAGAFIARANDPTAIFYNPAGIVGQKMGVAIWTTLITTKTDFAGVTSSLDAKMNSGFFYPSHLYAVAPIGPVSVGLGIFSPFGLGTEWPATYSGRNISTKAQIQSFYFNPAAGMKLGPVSVAAGLQAVYASVELKQVAQKALPGLGSVDVANLDLNANNSLNYGFNLGLQFSPIQQVAVGASYRSKVKCEFEGTAKFDVTLPTTHPAYATIRASLPQSADVKSSVTFPAIIGAGVAYTPVPALTVEADVVQMQWSVFDTLPITFTNAAYAALNSKIAEDYGTSRSYRIGAEYRVKPNLAVRAGYLYDESPQPDASVSPMLPDAPRNSAMLGLGYTWRKTTLDVSYMFLPFKNRSTNGKNPYGYNGTYDTTAHLFGITLVQRF